MSLEMTHQTVKGERS